MRVGEAYAPKRLFYGACMPWELAKSKEIGPAAKIVLMMLMSVSDQDGLSYPKREDLAEACGISVRTLSTCLSELKDSGFIAQAGNRKHQVAWEFLWHPILNSNNRRNPPTPVNRTVQILPSSESGTRQILPSSSGADKEDAAHIGEIGDFDDSEPDNCAESASLSGQNLPSKVGNICLAPPDIQNLEGNLPEPEGKRTPPPGTKITVPPSPTDAGCGGDVSDSPSVRGSPDTELQDLFDLARESIPPGKIGDTALLALLKGWRQKHGAPLLDSALEVAKGHQGPFTNWINFVTSTIQRKKRKEAESYAGTAGANDPRITAGR